MFNHVEVEALPELKTKNIDGFLNYSTTFPEVVHFRSKHMLFYEKSKKHR